MPIQAAHAQYAERQEQQDRRGCGSVAVTVLYQTDHDRHDGADWPDKDHITMCFARSHRRNAAGSWSC